MRCSTCVDGTYRSGQPHPTRMTSAWFGDGDADSTIVDNVFYVPNNNELVSQKGFGRPEGRRCRVSFCCAFSSAGCRSEKAITTETKTLLVCPFLHSILAVLRLTLTDTSTASDTPWTAGLDSSEPRLLVAGSVRPVVLTYSHSEYRLHS